MSRRTEIRLHGYHMKKSLSLSKISNINSHALDEDGYYYYVKNDFNDGNLSQSAILYAFRIERSTKCFHFLSNGHRIYRVNNHHTFKKTPEDAMRDAIRRARVYLNILRCKAEGVHQYLKALELPPHKTQELRIFERFLLRLDNIDDVPEDMLYGDKNPFEQDIPF